MIDLRYRTKLRLKNSRTISVSPDLVMNMRDIYQTLTDCQDLTSSVARQILKELKALNLTGTHYRGKNVSYIYIGNDEALQHTLFRPHQGIDHLVGHSLNCYESCFVTNQR